MLEMGESLSIINQTATQLLNMYSTSTSMSGKRSFSYVTTSKYITTTNLPKNKNNYYNYMEDLIEHFLA